MKKIFYQNKEHRIALNKLKKRLCKETQSDLCTHHKQHFSLQKQKAFLKEQNDLFTNSYSQGTSHLKQIDPFTDLRKEYTERGYRIPNISLSSNNNIFNSNPLLLVSGREIDFYYENNKNKETAKTERPKRYLVKIQKSLNQRMNNIPRSNNQRKLKQFSTFCTIRSDGDHKDNQSNNEETINENDNILQYNTMIEEMIEKDDIMGIIERKINKSKRMISKDEFLMRKIRKSHVKYNYRPSFTMNSFRNISSVPTEDNTNTNSHLESSGTDITMTRAFMKNKDQIDSIKSSNANAHLKFKYLKQTTNNTNQSSHTTNNTHVGHIGRCTNDNATATATATSTTATFKRNSVLGKITKGDSNVSTLLLERVFESKQRFFEYLREINISTITSESLIIIIREYLRKIKEWKEDTIKQFLSSESTIKEIGGIVLDFSQKIAHYDLIRSIPDKTKTLNIKRLMKIDSIAKGLPKFIIRRLIRGVSSRKKELSI